MKTNDVSEAAVEYFAEHSHNAWLKAFRKNNPAEKAKPRLRMRGGKLIDINKPWKDLDPKAQAENRVAARDAYAAVTKFPKDREAASAFVHECWIKRNKKDPNQPKALFAPYAKLPEVEKDKDRQHIDVMKEALMAVKKKAPKAVPKKVVKSAAKAKSSSKAGVAAKFDPATAQKLGSIAAELSALTGRKLTAEQVALAGAQAILSFYKVAL